MIFVTVGTQLPFDRLIEAIDTIAPSLGEPVFAQTGASTYTPRNIEWSARIRPIEVDAYFAKARVVVAHAGIGTILTCQRVGRPVILFPRLVAHGEHRNDHQMATVGQLEGRPGLYVARTGEELHALLAQDLAPPPGTDVVPEGRQRLMQHLDSVIRSAGAR
ncbi:glycosyltransferase [Sphingomonas sp. gentR]|uniref:Glucuronosyltransferase n=1 Tax=Sphingomonas yabuuchiae TaxID=172044 RepID=A0AA41DBS3_9SPHN|nr:glycosyltransferase [Sphingomonas sp. LK11]APX66043.1 glucuronosyltransferase [Sphingomonas sp. LK11]MBB4611048.1 UDP-N-acetylglucosamine transferase subunit ALG13 [Sphingomonas yabuuchiae]MBN3558266.1 glucuronosyltransferase [Sphingomonas yabuuchiae]